MDTRKFAMNYGGFLGLCLVAIALIMWSVGVDEKQSVIPGLLTNGVTIAFIAYAILQYRNIHQDGFISYSQSLKLGTTVAFFSSVILAFYQFLYISYLNPEALSEVMKITEQAMLEANPEVSDEELDMALEMTGKFMQPHWVMIMGMLGGTFMGFVYSLVISIFVKKDDPNKIA
jgi:glucan phosphoethanolaminetransferase (alkaline phosphatase superfamily)